MNSALAGGVLAGPICGGLAEPMPRTGGAETAQNRTNIRFFPSLPGLSTVFCQLSTGGGAIRDPAIDYQEPGTLDKKAILDYHLIR